MILDKITINDKANPALAQIVKPITSQMNLRTFLYGCIAGILMTIGSFALVCEINQIKWQPVYMGSK